MRRMRRVAPLLLVALISVMTLSADRAEAAGAAAWREIAPGVWKAVIGTPEPIDLLKAAGSVPRLAALKELGTASLPYNLSRIETDRFDGKTILRFPLASEEGIFGPGLNFQSVNQRGKVLELRVDHYGGADNGRTHAPVPFFVSDRGYGVLLNAARFIRISTGVGVRRAQGRFHQPQRVQPFVRRRRPVVDLTDADDHRAAFEELKARARGDSEAGRFFVRLVIEADQGTYSPAVLEELHLRLQEQHLCRAINSLRSALEEGDDVEQEQRRLFHLERLLQSVRASLTNLDPEEGRV